MWHVLKSDVSCLDETHESDSNEASGSSSLDNTYTLQLVQKKKSSVRKFFGFVPDAHERSVS